MHMPGGRRNELYAMLKLHEQTLNLPKNNAPALHAIRAGKVQKGKKHNKPQPSKAGRGQNQGNGKNKHAYAPKPKIPPPPKREDPAKDSICHECGETGHWKRNCPSVLSRVANKKKEHATLELVVVQTTKFGYLDELPPNGKTVGSKWLFKKKTDMDGAVHTNKARLVAKGYTQTPEIDYEETFISL
ncbi:zinc finger, CCHC-type containing protein [Tanacetum coccineum]